MSGIKPIDLTEFYRLLHGRGLSTEILAERIGVSGGTVRKLIGGFKPRRGAVWVAILRRLTPGEKALLFRVEQSPTWNSHVAARRETFTPEKAAQIAAAKRARELVSA